MSVFDELLRIKRFREMQAEIALAAARQSLDQARQSREQAESLLLEFREAAERQERAMYGDLCSRLVHVRDIQQVMDRVGGLREAESARAEHVIQAQAALDAARQEADRMRQTLQHATRIANKFVELAEQSQRVETREAEQREDLEMEEAASLVWDRSDWRALAEEGG